MQFYSVQFLALVLILMLLYYTIFKKRQWILLLIGSMVFYFLLGREFICAVLGISFVVWLFGRITSGMNKSYKEQKNQKGISREEKKQLKAFFTRKKRVILIITVVLIIGNLAVFKILNFRYGILLPIGISFYTFQALSYYFDIYMDKYEHEGNYLRFLLYVSWFPQMIQGPISRYDSLGLQFKEEHSFDPNNIKHAVFLFALGMLKKFAIADVLVPVVNSVFSDPANASGSMIVMGTVCSLIQLYCDFSGGIDMVLATSELFGLRLKDNFNQPYFSPSLADFWHRWHITLGDWMRDYIFYPLAVTKPMLNLIKWGTKHLGSAGRILPAIVGNIVVFFLVGVWHGTGWNYVLWGLYNGIIISVGELLKPAFDKTTQALHIRVDGPGLKLWRIIRTDLLVGLGEIIVMVGSVSYIPAVISHFFTRPDFAMNDFHAVLDSTILKSDGRIAIVIFLIIACVILIVRSVMRERGTDMREWILSKKAVASSAIFCLLIFTTLSAFIYQNVQGGFMYANF